MTEEESGDGAVSNLLDERGSVADLRVHLHRTVAIAAGVGCPSERG